MAYIIEVEYVDVDGENSTDLYGPHSMKRAEELAAKARAAIERIPPDPTGERRVAVHVRPLRRFRLREHTNEAKDFIGNW